MALWGREYAEGKKITWRDGVAALWHIIKFNLLDRMPAVSHPPREAAWKAVQIAKAVSLPGRSNHFFSTVRRKRSAFPVSSI